MYKRQIEDIKHKFHDLRQKAKYVEFAIAYGGDANTIMQRIGCTQEKAKEIYNAYMDAFPLVRDYQNYCKPVSYTHLDVYKRQPNGKLFKAKPMGDRETKEEYVRNFSYKYKNHFATVKYFYYSDGNDEVNGVPLQPCLKAFRDSIDMS